MALVIQPVIPYKGPIFEGIHEGKQIKITGCVPYGADRFTVNLMNGLNTECDDRPLHISVRFKNNTVVRNSYRHKSWDTEEKTGCFPFTVGRNFTMIIQVENTAYQIFVDGQQCWSFTHRLPYTGARSIFINGHVSVERIEFINKVKQIPYRGAIPGGVHEGKLIEIKGHVPYGADVFTVNLLTGLDPNSDRPLHLSVRFHSRTVVRNALQQNNWGPEETHGMFPFAAGKDFTMLILVDPAAYRIAVNSQHCYEFPHRIPFQRVSSIFVDGSVRIERIEFVDKMNPYQQPGTCIPSFPVYPPVGPRGHHIPSLPGMPPAVFPSLPSMQPAVCPAFPATHIVPPPENMNSNLSPVYNPSIPYAYPIYGGLKPGMMIYISGRPSASPYKFTINLQNGTAPYPPPDIAFHFDVRFYNFTVVRNTRCNNAWAAEETTITHFPFQPAVNFDMIIKVENDRYMVALNGQHFLEFRHRLTPLSRFDTLYIENDVVVSSIRFA